MATTDELLKLDVQARLRIIDELWESILQDLNDPGGPDGLPVTDEMRVMLDQRAAAYHAAPDRGSPWTDVRARILKRR